MVARDSSVLFSRGHHHHHHHHYHHHHLPPCTTILPPSSSSFLLPPPLPDVIPSHIIGNNHHKMRGFGGERWGPVELLGRRGETTS